MKTKSLILLSACLALTLQLAIAQIDMPAPSPTATFKQKVGLTDVEITYSRPSIKDRVVFGDLVPYGKLWRTGANMASKVTFGEDVTVAGKNVPAGSYAIFTIPGENEWTVILNKNWKQGGTGQYQESEDVVRTQVKPVKLGTSMESFTILLDDIRPSSASLAMIWDKTMVELPFEVESDAKVMASIEKALNVDANEYFQAATYYHESGKDLKQAHDWVTQAIGMYEKNDQSPFWVYRRKALIEADMKDYKTAISTARQSLEKAKAAGNDDYVRMNEKSIAEWEKM